jgi:hypothetical protein
MRPRPTLSGRRHRRPGSARRRPVPRRTDYDPFVRSRIEAGRTLSAADYMAMLRDRTVLVRAMDARACLTVYAQAARAAARGTSLIDSNREEPIFSSSRRIFR